jgi:hypothetical protein
LGPGRGGRVRREDLGRAIQRREDPVCCDSVRKSGGLRRRTTATFRTVREQI